MKAELILFDLDDTLMAFDLVSEQAWDQAIDVFLQNHSINIDKESLLDKIHKTRKWYWADPERHKLGRKNIINARREIVKLAFNNFQNITNIESEKVADDYSQIHEKLWFLLDGVEETLKNIKNKNIKLGVITNGTSEGQRGKLERFNIMKYFDFIYIESEVGYGKPDIKIFDYMLKETKTPCEKIIMVGDNLVWDIEPPQKLGIYAVWINTKKAKLEETKIRPNKIIKKIPDIMYLLD